MPAGGRQRAGLLQAPLVVSQRQGRLLACGAAATLQANPPSVDGPAQISSAGSAALQFKPPDHPGSGHGWVQAVGCDLSVCPVFSAHRQSASNIGNPRLGIVGAGLSAGQPVLAGGAV